MVRRLLVPMLASFLMAAGCGGAKGTTSEDSFQQMVDAINAQHPPLYDGTNVSYPPPSP